MISPRLSDDEMEETLVNLNYKLEMEEWGDCIKLQPIISALTELQSLRAANGWRTDWGGAPRDGTEILIFLSYQYHSNEDVTSGYAVAAFEDGYWVAEGERLEDGYTTLAQWKPLIPPNSTNTDIVAEGESK